MKNKQVAYRNTLITGITGNDGSYLAKFLLNKNYKVFGLVRRTSHPTTSNLSYLGILDAVTIIPGDLADQNSITRAIEQATPDELYHLGAQSYVTASFNQPVYTSDITALGTLRVLEAVRQVNPKIKVYNACSSEMFGNQPAPQNENTPFDPCSPYAAAKVFSFQIAKIYRNTYHIPISNGILFNHDGPLRSDEFVTRKITSGLAKIKHGKQKKLVLGNLTPKRDWGYVEDYVEAMWMMLQRAPDDFVIATGNSHSVGEFLFEALHYVGIECGCVENEPKLYRPLEVYHLEGDATKAHKMLNWHPKISFRQLVHIMMEHDLTLESKND